MRALVAEAFGGPDCARIREWPRPKPGHGEVLIEAQAWSLNFLDVLMIAGHYQVRPEPPFVPGRDVAGRVVALGLGVETLQVGDLVCAEPRYGAFAEFVVAPEYACLKTPGGLSATDLAASATAYATVVAAMRLRAKLQPAEWVLVTGAAGGVGSAGVQYARRLGARVVALVSSQEKADAVRRLGAEVAIRSDKLPNVEKGLRDALNDAQIPPVDAVIDVVGGETFKGALRCLRQGGRCIIVGFASGQIPQIPANYLLLRDLAVVGSSLDSLLRTRNADFRNCFLEALEDVSAGRLSAEVAAVLPLSKFSEAAALMSGRRLTGKIVFQGI